MSSTVKAKAGTHNVWKDVQQELRSQLSAQQSENVWEIWLSEVYAESIELNGSVASVRICAPRSSWVRQRFGLLIQGVLESELGCEVRLEIREADYEARVDKTHRSSRAVVEKVKAKRKTQADKDVKKDNEANARVPARKRKLKKKRRTADATYYVPRPLARRGPAIFGRSTGKYLDLHGEVSIKGNLKAIDQATVALLAQKYNESESKDLVLSVSEITDFLKQRTNYGGVDAKMAERSLRRLHETHIEAPSDNKKADAHFVGYVIKDLRRQVGSKVFSIEDYKKMVDNLSDAELGRLYGSNDSGSFVIQLSDQFLSAAKKTPVKVDAAAHCVLGKTAIVYTWLLSESRIRNKGWEYGAGPKVMTHLGQNGGPTKSSLTRANAELGRIRQIDNRFDFTVRIVSNRPRVWMVVRSEQIACYEVHAPRMIQYERVIEGGDRIVYMTRGDP